MSTVVTKNLAVQNNAGTASANISFDGNKLVSTALDNSITATANLHDLGVGQTWQDVTASRSAAGVTYTNSTGKPIVVAISTKHGASASTAFFYSEPHNVLTTYDDGRRTHCATFIVEAGKQYSHTHINGTLISWSELR